MEPDVAGPQRVDKRPWVASIVGVDGCGKSSTFRGALEVLSRHVAVVGIGDEVLAGGPGRPVHVRTDIPLSRSARIVGRVAKGQRSSTIYKNLKFLELSERAHICRHVLSREGADIVLTDGQPLVNSAAWCAARFFRDELTSDELLTRSFRYMSGAERIPLSDAPFYLRRAWQLVLVNWLRLAHFLPPDHVFLLDLDGAAAMERIKARGKPLQAHETEAFLEELGASYRRVCRVFASDYGIEVATIPVDRVSLDDTVRTVADVLLDGLVQRSGKER